MSRHTSSGILAIWREGEVCESSVLPVTTQRTLRLLGNSGVHALVAGIFEARNFELGPEWHDPREHYLDNSLLAWRLGEVSGEHPGLSVVTYHNARTGEVFDMQSGIQTGYSVLVDTGRQLARVGHPGLDTELERARLKSQGRVYVPIPGWDNITAHSLAELLADPAPQAPLADVIQFPVPGLPRSAAA